MTAYYASSTKTDAAPGRVHTFPTAPAAVLPARPTAHAHSFGLDAVAYDRWRPGYPVEAVTWATAPLRAHARVVDLGSGTGILAAELAGLGFDVVPIEPDAAMREQLVRSRPDLCPLDGSAEDIPLPDGSVDAVLAGQAYHWFHHDLAHEEIARVLRPGGVLATLWNSRDASVPWVAALNALASDAEGYHGILDDAPELRSFGGRFSGLTTQVFHHVTSQTPASLLGLVSTTSYYLMASQQRRRELEIEVGDLCTSRPELAGRSDFDLPHRSTVYRARRLTPAEDRGRS